MYIKDTVRVNDIYASAKQDMSSIAIVHTSVANGDRSRSNRVSGRWSPHEWTNGTDNEQDRRR